MNMRKILVGGLLATAAIGASLALATSANADTVSNPASCTPVPAHTEYKWVPDVTNAGPTQWTTYDKPANTKATFPWKGKDVAYHRDGNKSQFVSAVTCNVTEPTFNYDVNTCSVTVPYTPGIDTRLYGVNGYSQDVPITRDVTVTAGLGGADGTAPQFWIGYKAQPDYVDTNPGAGTTHIDFAPACTTVVITSQAQADALSGTTIDKNIDVPAGVTRDDGSPIWLQWAHITGSVSIEGNLFMSADTVDGDVTVSGPGSFLGLSNYASHFAHDLNVQNSSGIYTGGPGTTSFGNWTQYNGASQVDGNFNFTNNGGGLYSGYPMHVNGSLSYTGNTGPVLDRSGLTADGGTNA